MTPWWKWSYGRLSTDTDSEVGKQLESTNDENERQPSNIQRYQLIKTALRKYTVHLLVGLGVTAIIVGFSVSKLHRGGNSPPLLCGNSSAEAESLGCTFDQLTWSYYPPECPHYANDEFLSFEQWRYYDDPHSKIPASSENWTRALDNKQKLWGERGEHLSHCVFMFLSIGQIIRDGTPLPSKLAEYEHLAHCSEYLLSALKTDPTWHNLETLVPNAQFDVYC